MKKGLTRGGLIFATAWLGIFAVAYLTWAINLGIINKRLAEYESIQPKHAAERIFNECFLYADTSEMIEFEEGFYSEYDKKGAPEKALSDALDGKRLSYKAENKALYSVYADGEMIAQFTLIPHREVTPLLGAHEPTLGEIDFLVKPTVDVTVIAPKGAVVKVNGKTVTDDKISGAPIYLDNAEYFPNDAAREMVSYRIEGLFAEPVVSVESADGAVRYGVDLMDASHVYSAEYSYVSYLRDAYYGKSK